MFSHKCGQARISVSRSACSFQAAYRPFHDTRLLDVNEMQIVFTIECGQAGGKIQQSRIEKVYTMYYEYVRLN